MTTQSANALPLPISESLPENIVKEEKMLLRECFYVVQGISGDRIRFDSNGKVTVRSPVIAQAGYSDIVPPHLRSQSKLGSGAKEAILICAEAGWLYSRVKEYVDTIYPSNRAAATQDRRVGSIQRALASALQLELQSYQHFLSELEPKIPNMSLRQLLVQMKAPIFRLEQLASLTDGAANFLPGPQILHSLRLASQHGDSRQRTMIHSLLSRACTPWFDMLYLWTTQGILSDPAHEFFVVATESNGDYRHLWKQQYRLDYDKVPIGILDEDLIQPAFVVGKAINYIRKCLQDGGWSLQLVRDDDDRCDSESSTAMVDQIAKKALGFTYTPEDLTSGKRTVAPIRVTLTRAASLVHSHILTSLHRQHSLFQHLFALKQFLLLGQGDFFATLMIGIHNEFEGRSGISGIYRHTLAAIVDSALRNTNATGFPSDILARLNVELNLKADDDARFHFAPPKGGGSSKDTRTVWDIFELEYHVPDPLLVIVHPEAMGLYKTMFHLLFDIRRLEFMLNLTWRQSAALQHSLQKMVQRNGVTVNKSPEYAQCTILLRKVSMIRQAMTHFVTNLKSYLMFEVLEGEWKKLVRTMHVAETLDEAIKAHDDYLGGINRKSFLHYEDKTREDTTLGNQLRACLSLAKDFCSYQEDLFKEAIEKAEIANAKKNEAALRLGQGDWGISDAVTELFEEENMFFGLSDKTKMAELDELSVEFDDHVETLLRAFDAKLNGRPIFSKNSISTPVTSPSQHGHDQEGDKVHDDLNSLRFLSFQLNCNKYYNA